MAEKGSLTTREEKTKLNYPSKSSGGWGNNSKNSRNAKKALKSSFKQFGIIGAIVLVVVLAFGVLLGSMASHYASANDGFTMVGDRYVQRFVGQKYEDEGVKAIEYGIDVSDKVEKSGSFYTELENGTSQEEGSFYIVYKINTIKFGKLTSVELTRVVTFVSPSESDDFVPYIIYGTVDVSLNVGEIYNEGLTIKKYKLGEDETVVEDTAATITAEIKIKEVFERTVVDGEKVDVKIEGENPLATIINEDNTVKTEASGKTYVLVYEAVIDGASYDFTRILTIGGE